MQKYAVLYEPTSTGFSALAPDLPGCGATGKTLEQARQRMYDAVHFHLEAMRERGDPIPVPLHVVEMPEVA